jgi:aspartate/methionine/tyrosine aminotransferase
MKMPPFKLEEFWNKYEFTAPYLLCYSDAETWSYLEIDENRRVPSIADAYEKGSSLNVMTKSFGLVGLRIGWIATRDADMPAILKHFETYLQAQGPHYAASH